MEETTKRERGTGSIFHNGSAVWWIKFYVRGIPKRESSHSTDLEVAKKLLKRRLAEVETKTYVMRTNVKIDELITDLLAEYRRERRKTTAEVESRWKKHLEPFFGRMKVDDINTDTVQRYSTKRTEGDGADGPTVNRELAILKHAFHLGMKSTPPKVRACPVMPMYKENPARKGFLDDDQYTLLARQCNREGLWFRALLTTAYSFAFRKGELLNLRVRQVDLASRQIRLDAGTTKNDEGRIAPMTDEVFTLLTACVVGKQKNDYVFTRPAAKPGLPAEPVRGFRRRWAKVCCAVGLGELVCPDCYPELESQTIDAKGRCSACGKKWRRQQLKYVGLLFHDLRRSGVRNLIRVGVQQKVAMSISGHKTASVFQRYNIVDERDIMEAGRKLNEKQKSNALLEIPFGQSSGMISTRTGHSDHSEAAPLPALLPN